MNILTALVYTFSATAMAQDPDVGLDPLLPIPTLKYDRPPPDFSWEFGVHLSYGDVGYWKREIPPWVGFGLRIGWGKNFTDSYAHRIGVTTLLFVEGPLLVHMSLGVEPQLTWDWVQESGLWMGAGVGGAVMYNNKSVGTTPVRDIAVAPSASVRLGWSQSWTRVGRRLFFGVEVRGRVVNENIGPTASLVLGSGKGY